MPGVRFPVTELFSFCFRFFCSALKTQHVGALMWGIGAIGSVRASQARGTGIETLILQLFILFLFFLLQKNIKN